MKHNYENWHDSKMLDSISALSEEVTKNMDKLEILQYYPYGPNTIHKSWMRTIDLTEEYRESYNEQKTEHQIVGEIYESVGRAMHYSIVASPGFSKHQAIQAFGQYQLFYSGLIGWNKKITRGKSIKQIEALEKKNKLLIDLMYGERYVKHQQELLERKSWDTDAEYQAYIELHKKGIIENRKKYGVVVVTHLPLRQPLSDFKILYSKQELAAISYVVDMSFENMC